MIVPWARFVPTPNQSEREGQTVECVVIHHISLPPGRFGGPYIEDFFRNKLDTKADDFFKEIEGVEVSAHFLIYRSGEVVQFVDTDRAAWHAGVSSWQGREKVNLFSLGIEMEGDETSGYTEKQYRSLDKLLKALRDEYPALGPDSITGHEDIAPGRKTDPGPLFDWDRAKNSFA